MIHSILLYNIKENKNTYCFNILELKEQIDKGDTRNPYTRNQLPVEEIISQYNNLKKRLVDDRLELTNILEQIKNTDIMSEENIVSLQVTNLSGLLEYVTHNMIMSLSREQIGVILNYMKENPLFLIIKKDINLRNFVEESIRNLNIDDIHKNTRKAALTSYIMDTIAE